MVHRLRTQAPLWEASRAYWNSAYLKRLGFQPQTVIDPQAVRQHIAGFAEKGVISKYGIPDQVLIVDSLEKTSVGKLDKKALRQRYATPSEVPPDATLP